MAAAPIAEQQKFWNEWNKVREAGINAVSADQAAAIRRWLGDRRNLNILDSGCGSGWLCEILLEYGRVTGTDLAAEIVERAAIRVPNATFIAGDFLEIDIKNVFDVVTSLEVLSHVYDQASYLKKIATMLKPQGELLIATQNAFVLRRCSNIAPPGAGQLRKWVTTSELRELLTPHFEILALTTLTPRGDMGILRAVNSPKLNGLLGTFISGDRIKRMKERLHLGWTIMARARRKP